MSDYVQGGQGLLSYALHAKLLPRRPDSLCPVHDAFTGGYRYPLFLALRGQAEQVGRCEDERPGGAVTAPGDDMGELPVADIFRLFVPRLLIVSIGMGRQAA